MKNKLREKEHKKIVTYMRRVNKQIMNDEYLGINRFRIDMEREYWWEFSDKSGGELSIYFKIKDNDTGNWAIFNANNYDYVLSINKYANDFLIRSSSGWAGHYPHLQYLAYDVHDIKPYGGRKETPKEKYEEGVIDYYNWLS